VGGHTVKMDRLRQLFDEMGFANPATFIASGNVIFEAPAQQARDLELQIEEAMRSALGYKVSTFIRTNAELGAIARYSPFLPAELNAAQAFNVAFLAGSPDADSIQQLMALKTEIDNFHVSGKEVYWLCRVKQSQSTFSNAVLEKTLGRPSTIRGVNTIQKMAALHPYQE
jgi:uncharacterized protein (DUF1697 family)